MRPDGTPLRARRGGRARAPRRARGAGLLERSRSAPPSASSRPRAATRSMRATPSWRCGRATSSCADEEGFLYFVGRNDEMIKTSGYRVSPTEIEEVAYGTGLVRDAVALGVEDPRLGQRIVLVVSPADGELDADAAARGAEAGSCRCYMVPGDGRSCATSCRAPQRQVRPQPAAPGAGGMSDAQHDRRVRRDRRRARVGGIPLDRLAERVGGDAVLRLRPRGC